MTRCNKCNVLINSSVKICPLCRNDVEAKVNNDIFPYIESSKKHGIWQKVVSVLFLIAVFNSSLIDYMMNNTFTWSIYVDLALICVCVSILIATAQKRSLPKLLILEYVFISVACIFWDRYTGNINWSLNYVLPLLSTVYVLLNFTLRIVFRRDFIYYFRNMIVTSIIGIVCAFLLHYGIITINWPSYLSAIIGIIAIVGMTICDGKKVHDELKKRLHI